jgi:K(+)-stimulated pyrophosphate-energized sodium pump
MLGASPFETIALWAVLGIALLGLAYALFLRRQIMAEDKGNSKMIEVWEAIRQGADAYLGRQLKTILPLIVVLTVALFFSVYIVPPSAEALERFPGLTPDRVKLIIGIGRAGAFVLGALFSLMVGQFGMRMAVQGNVRVAAAARTNFDKALKIAYRAGTITGMLTDGLGLLGGTVIFMVFQKAAPDALLGFGFGGTLLALFMRVGGGIYTKAADVGADLVGKVEACIPEDDPRNAAVVADLVGDNVGDCAGMAADIFESYEVTIVSGLILGLALVSLTGQIKWIIFPLLVRGIGVLSSIIGTYQVRGKKGEKTGNAMAGINRGFYTSAALCLVAFAFLAHFYMDEWHHPGHRYRRADQVFHRHPLLSGQGDRPVLPNGPRHGDPVGAVSGDGIHRLGHPGHRLDDPFGAAHLLGPAGRLCPLRCRHDRNRHADTDRE